MELFSILIVLLGLVFGAPWIIAGVLKLVLRKFNFKVKTWGYFKYSDISLEVTFPLKLSVQLGHLSIQLRNQKLYLELSDLSISFEGAQKFPSQARTSPLKMLLLRLGVLILGKLLVFKIRNIEFHHGVLSIREQLVLCSFEVHPENAEIRTKVNMKQTQLLISKSNQVQLSSMTLQMTLPPYISLKTSFEKAQVSLVVGEASGNLEVESLQTLQTGTGTTESPSLSIPKLVSVTVNDINVTTNNLVFSASRIKSELLTKKLIEASLEVTKVQLEAPDHTNILSLPEALTTLSYSQNKLSMRTTADEFNLSATLPLAEFIAKCIPTSVSEHKAPSTISLEYSISLKNVNLDLKEPKSTLLLGNLNSVQVTIDRKIKIECVSAEVNSFEGSEVLKLNEPQVLISEVVEFTTQKVLVEAHEQLYKKLFPVVLDIARVFRKRLKHRPKSIPKRVFLEFNQVSACEVFENNFTLEAQVRVFKANFLAKDFSLYFESANLSSDKNWEVISVQSLSVDKNYTESKLARVYVEGDQVDLTVPHNYHLGIAIYKTLTFHKLLIDWTRAFLFPNKNKPQKAFVPETALTHIAFTQISVKALENPLEKSVRRKLQVNPYQDILPQLKTQEVSELLYLKVEALRIQLDNTQLSSPTQILQAMQEIDPFEVPSEEFFRLFMPNDMKLEVTGVVANLRDYPFELVQVKQVLVEGRGIISKNNLPLPLWALIKNHFDYKVSMNGIECTAGLCCFAVLKEVFGVVEKLIPKAEFRRVIKDCPTYEFDPLDKARYANVGKLEVTVSDVKALVLGKSSPYQVEGFTLSLESLNLKKDYGWGFLSCENLKVSCEEREFVSVRFVQSNLNYDFLSNTDQHWFTDTQVESRDIFETFRAKDLKISGSLEVPLVENSSLVLSYHSKLANLLWNFLFFHFNPPCILVCSGKPQKNSLVEYLNCFEIKKVKIEGMKTLVLGSDDTGLEFRIQDIEGKAKVSKLESYLFIPWELKDTQAKLSMVCMNRYDGLNWSSFWTKTSFLETEPQQEFCATGAMMVCENIEYFTSESENFAENNLRVKGFKLLIVKELVDVLIDLLTTNPPSFPKRSKSPRPPPEETTIIESPNLNNYQESPNQDIHRTKKLLVEIHQPQINLQNQDSLSQFLVIGGFASCEVIEETLQHDHYKVDLKRCVSVFMQSIEAFVTSGLVDLNKPVIWLEEDFTGREGSQFGMLWRVFLSKNMKCNIFLFRLTECEFDFDKNQISSDKKKWKNQNRINKVQVALPEISGSMESEQLWTAIDVLQSVSVQQLQKVNLTEEELQRETEFKRFGNRALEKKLTEQVMGLHVYKRPCPCSIVSLSVDSVVLQLTKNQSPILGVQIINLYGEQTSYGDSVSQKSLELHKLTLEHNGVPLLSPLLGKREEYLHSNVFISVRLSDRTIKGENAYWGCIDHIELFLFPMNIDISTDLYNDIYEFVFPPEQEEEIQLITKNSKKLPPLNKRRKLPRFYRYVHINEVKVALNIRGFIGLNNTKIKLASFTMKQKFKTFQQFFDKFMAHAKNNVISQVPSIAMQTMGYEKKDFLPSNSPKKSFFSRFRKGKNAFTEEEEKEHQKAQSHKLMFGKSNK